MYIHMKTDCRLQREQKRARGKRRWKTKGKARRRDREVRRLTKTEIVRADCITTEAPLPFASPLILSRTRRSLRNSWTQNGWTFERDRLPRAGDLCIRVILYFFTQHYKLTRVDKVISPVFLFCLPYVGDAR